MLKLDQIVMIQLTGYLLWPVVKYQSLFYLAKRQIHKTQQIS